MTAFAMAGATEASTLHFVVPGDIDDPALPSGGNTYDRQLCSRLPGAGRTVEQIAIPGMWPEPGVPPRAELDRRLAAVPDGAAVLLDGLIAGAAPEVLALHTGRLRLVVLVHMLLGDELGLGPTAAADRTDREHRALRSAHAIVATSAWAARRVTAVHGVHPDNVHVVTPGVDPASLTDTDAAGARLLCVGSITPTKGQDLLVNALALVADRNWSARLVGPLTRDPGHVEAVLGLVQNHGLGARIQVTGPRTGAALDAEYAAADLLVLPSRTESYGMVVTEALARGIPVLACAVDGVPDTLGKAPDGTRPGLLVRPDDVGALAAALRSWLEEPGLREAAVTAARARRDRLTGWEVTAKCLTDVLAILR